jgi:hypothetical protein
VCGSGTHDGYSPQRESLVSVLTHVRTAAGCERWNRTHEMGALHPLDARSKLRCDGLVGSDAADVAARVDAACRWALHDQPDGGEVE